ncbi:MULTISPECIES: phosphotransferase enzyme family protein [Paenibacillus]|uniref:phosphotransferase enzyme family protein n=1 Tax=Paenibacillus TaxID=44249 RepID=UPI0022B8F622|nr:phosphotransferase [Paenibacillus caseinilyticus]MCZ8523876.1 phosphotransferase [Paenibacillus caseinilyticus]
MRLSRIADVVRTLDGKWKSPLADRAVSLWPHEPGTAVNIRVSANAVFRYREEGKVRFLRLTDADDRSIEVLEAELQVLQQLAAAQENGASMRAAQPVPSLAGRMVEVCDTPWGSWHVCAFEGLPGRHPDSGRMTPAEYTAWGAALGRLHQALKALPGVVADARPDWRELLGTAELTLAGEALDVRQELAAVRAKLNTFGEDQEQYGLIHYDFETDNLLWEDEAVVGIIDFDDCCRLWYEADIAYALRDLGESGGSLEGPLYGAFIQGYRQESALREEGLSARLPWFYRLHRLLSLARLLRAVDVEARQLPESLQELHTKLQRLIGLYRQEAAGLGGAGI